MRINIKKACVIRGCKASAVTATIGLFLCLCGCAKQDPPEYSRLVSLKPAPTWGVNNIRVEALKQAARGVGAQTALAWRSKQIDKMLEDQKHHLDHIFDFNYLVLNSNVLPPVLVEGQNTLNLDNDSALRIADRDYQIVSYPRFITAPPTWRDYIWMGYKKPEMPNFTLLPKNSKESAVWNCYIKVGWNEGVKQAEEIFDANLNRLRRDYAGMLLYRKLLTQNMINAPFVSNADLGVTGGGSTLRINDRVLRITNTSTLNANPKEWKPVISAEQKEKDDDNDNVRAQYSISDKYRSVISNKVGGPNIK